MLTVDDPVEIWTVTLRNDSDRARRLSVFPYCAWQLASFIRADNAHMWFQTSDWLEEEGCILAEYRDPHRLGLDFKGFMASSAPVEGYECSERAFLGRFYHAYAAPKAVEKGGLSDSRGYSEQCIGALHHRVELAPGEEKRIEIVVGFEPDAAARREYIEKYEGRFDMGWDAAREQILARQKELGVVPENTQLTERIPEIPAWDSLTDDEKKLYARQMEVFAAQMEHVDHQIGRVVETLERIGELENTLIFVTADNGASGEGGLAGTFNETYVLNGLQTPFDAIPIGGRRVF